MRLGAAQAAGLHTDQGPPLAIPASFFSLAPLSLLAAGILLAAQPDGGSRWTPTMLAATHIGTLGLLGGTMLGALYQMLPVLAGAPVPRPRLAHGVWLLWVVGTVALVGGLLLPTPWAFAVAMAALAGALLLFLPPVAIALARAPHRTGEQRGLTAHRVEVHGMRLALLSLTIVALYGLRMAWGWAHMSLPSDRVALVTGHLVAGLLGWVGVLLTTISTQIVPMFYLTRPVARRPALLALTLVAGSVLAAALAPLLGGTAHTVLWLAAPAALVIWIAHPALMLWLLANRRRKRADMSVRFWQTGLAVAPLLIGVVIAGLVDDDPRWPVLFGWLALFGWAGLILHGMLTRILPFLVWFHRYAPLAGLQKVPPMRHLLPASRARPALLLHAGGVLVGAVGIGFDLPVLLRIGGLGLAGSGAVLSYAMVRMLARASRNA